MSLLRMPQRPKVDFPAPPTIVASPCTPPSASAQSRLSVTDDGALVYRCHHPWRNGKTAVVMDPMTFRSRLAA